jgi:hypothetical protein
VPSATPVEPERVFDPFRVSPSRINAMLSCGVAFKLKYIDRVPEESSGSAALFGSVIHRALEWWAPDRTQDIVPLVEKAWKDCVEGTAAIPFLKEYQEMSRRVIRVKHKIAQDFEKKNKRPCKMVTMTNDWKKHPIRKEVDALVARHHPLIEADPAFIWTFTENDPLPSLYDQSLPLAKRYAAKWSHLPAPIYVEFEADCTWKCWDFTCRIDVVEPLIERATGEVKALGITDYKTYAQESPPQKDWRQGAMYDRGVAQMIEDGRLEIPEEYADLPIWVGFDYVKLGERKYRQYSEPDFERLDHELTLYSQRITNGDFLPADKNRNPNFCPYPSQCCLTSTAAAGGLAEPKEIAL